MTSVDICCSAALSPLRDRTSRWLYFASSGLSSILCWIFRENGAAFTNLKNVARPQLVQAVLRMTFATFIFFAAHFATISGLLLLEATRHRAAQVAHRGLFPLKLLAWFLLCIISFFAAPNDAMGGFFQVARVLAAVFLLLQLIVVLETVFKLNETMISRKECMWPIIAGTALLYIGFMASLVLLYVWFAPSGGCLRNIFFITFSFILAIASSALSVSPLRIESAGLLTAALVSTYGIWLCASALYSAPSDKCSALPVSTSTDSSNWITVTSFIFTMLSLVVACMSTARSHSEVMGRSPASPDSAVADFDEDEPPYGAVFLHFTFMCATCFMLMAFTNWSLQNTPGRFELDKGTTSMWMKIATQWLGFALYAWILLAPRILRSREYS